MTRFSAFGICIYSSSLANYHANCYLKSGHSEISTNLRTDSGLHVFSSVLHSLWNEYALSTGVYKLMETAFQSSESEEVLMINVQ